jgi:hypothetical protein
MDYPARPARGRWRSPARWWVRGHGRPRRLAGTRVAVATRPHRLRPSPRPTPPPLHSDSATAGGAQERRARRAASPTMVEAAWPERTKPLYAGAPPKWTASASGEQRSRAYYERLLRRLRARTATYGYHRPCWTDLEVRTWPFRVRRAVATCTRVGLRQGLILARVCARSVNYTPRASTFRPGIASTLAKKRGLQRAAKPSATEHPYPDHGVRNVRLQLQGACAHVPDLGKGTLRIWRACAVRAAHCARRALQPAQSALSRESASPGPAKSRRSAPKADVFTRWDAAPTS